MSHLSIPQYSMFRVDFMILYQTKCHLKKQGFFETHTKSEVKPVSRFIKQNPAVGLYIKSPKCSVSGPWVIYLLFPRWFIIKKESTELWKLREGQFLKEMLKTHLT